MKISDAIKTKLAGAMVIILGLCFMAFPIIEINSKNIHNPSKYGGGEILAGKHPFEFRARVIFELFRGLIITSGIVILLLKKIPKK